METPITVAWRVPISKEDLQRLQNGFTPTEMEQRWAINTKSNNEGHLSVHISRHWNKQDHYILKAKERADGGADIEEITWSSRPGNAQVSEEEGKKGAVNLCRRLLGCEFKSLET